MKKSTTALSLAALMVTGGIYVTTSTLSSAFAAEAVPVQSNAATTDTGGEFFTAIAHSTSSEVPSPSQGSVPVEDKREIRCYYRADLSSEYQETGSSASARPPYSTTGIESLEFDARNNPTPEDPRAGLLQVSDPINQCSRVWDLGLMNLKGINDDLIPSDFVSPAADPSAERPSAPVSGKDQNGKPLYENPDIKAAGNFIPHLTECVVDGIVSVVPGPANVCKELGVPDLAH